MILGELGGRTHVDHLVKAMGQKLGEGGEGFWHDGCLAQRGLL